MNKKIVSTRPLIWALRRNIIEHEEAENLHPNYLSDLNSSLDSATNYSSYEFDERELFERDYIVCLYILKNVDGHSEGIYKFVDVSADLTEFSPVITPFLPYTPVHQSRYSRDANEMVRRIKDAACAGIERWNAQ